MANSTKKPERKDAFKVRRIRKTGDLPDLQRKLWQVVSMCWDVIRSDKTTLEEKRAHGHLMSQTAGTYTKLCETLDLADELKEVRKELAELRGSEGMRKVV